MPASRSRRGRSALLLLAAVFLLLPGADASTADALETQGIQGKTRVLTIADAIQLALTNNLNIRISAINPMVDQFTLNGLYSAYDPAFNFSAVRNSNISPGGGSLADTPITIPSSTATIESYSAGISGALPTGLTYSLTGPLQWQQFNSASGSYSVYASAPGIALQQSLLKNAWFNGPRYQISLARKNLQIDQLALRLQVMTVINNVKAAYYNLVYARENVRVQVAALRLADQLVLENKKKVQLGVLARLDEKQAESQAASSRANLLSAQDAQIVQQNILKNLLTSSYSEWAKVTPVPAEPLVAVPEVIDVNECWRTGVEMRPDLEEAKLAVEKLHVAIKYQFNQLFPEVDVIGTYGHNATTATFADNVGVLSSGHYPFYSYGVQMTIPLSNVGARNAYKSAKASLQQALLQLKRTEQTIVIAIDNDVEAVRSDLLRVDATREARAFAEDALQAEQTKLEHGKSSSFFVLQLQSNLTSARSAEIRALADYNIALEQLSLDEGTILERNHIYLQPGFAAGGVQHSP
jgi:outer membrane protein TolC